jgi:hypothetical protein
MNSEKEGRAITARLLPHDRVDRGLWLWSCGLAAAATLLFSIAAADSGRIADGCRAYVRDVVRLLLLWLSRRVVHVADLEIFVGFCRAKRMTNRLSLAALLLFCTAAPAWVYFTYVVAQSPGFGPLAYSIVPLVLAAATVAIYTLTNRTWFGLALASLISVIALFGSLLLIAVWSASGS